jgi:hypothetical protein
MLWFDSTAFQQLSIIIRSCKYIGILQIISALLVFKPESQSSSGSRGQSAYMEIAETIAENPLFPLVPSANWHFSIRNCFFCVIFARRNRVPSHGQKSWSKVEYPQEADEAAASLRIAFIESSLWSESERPPFPQSVLIPSAGCMPAFCQAAHNTHTTCHRRSQPETNAGQISSRSQNGFRFASPGSSECSMGKGAPGSWRAITIHVFSNITYKAFVKYQNFKRA